MKQAHLQVSTVAATDFWYSGLPTEVTAAWETDATGGPALIEFAGRACYQSWSKPNPKTATNFGYIDHILEVGHYSVLEHASVTFYITGVSRSFTHELVRHRHLSYSQLSQRYVNESDVDYVMPPGVQVLDPEGDAQGGFAIAMAKSKQAYQQMLAAMEEAYADEANVTLRRKLARQAARAVLPNATETKIVVTGNLRAWRHFISLRATEHADVEIREVAIVILKKLQSINRAVFEDFVITTLADGTEVASSPHAA